MLSLSVYPWARLEWSDCTAFYHVADSRRLWCCCCCCCCLAAQSCPTPCDPMDCQAPLIHGIFQARRLEWIAISFSSCAKYFKTKHSVTLSLPLKLYGSCHLPGDGNKYLGYLFTSFPVPKVLLPLPFSWLLPLLSSHFSLRFTFSAAVLACADLLDHINLFQSTYPAELFYFPVFLLVFS